MAKGKRKSEPGPGEFRVVGVAVCTYHLITSAPPKVLKYFQRCCHSRQDLIDYLPYYAMKNNYIGNDQFYNFDSWLEIKFIDTNNITYTISLFFAECWEIQRTYADGYVRSKFADSLLGNQDSLLDWTGPDDDSESAE